MRKKDRIPLNSVGVIIKEGREKKNIEIRDLAWQINSSKVSEKTVRNWEKGKEFPDLDMIYKLAEILDLNPNEMLKIRNQIQEESYTAEGNGMARKLASEFLDISGPLITTAIKIVAGGCIIYIAFWLNDLYRRVGGLDDPEQYNLINQIMDNAIEEWVPGTDSTDTVVESNIVDTAE